MSEQDKAIKIILPEKKVSVESSFIDGDGYELSTQELTNQVLNLLKKKTTPKANNAVKNRVFPLLAEAGIYLTDKYLGKDMSAVFAANPGSTMLITYALATGFYLNHFMHKKNMKINTNETKMTKAEIDKALSEQSLQSAITMALMEGQNPEAVIKKLYQKGKVTREQLKEYKLDYIIEGTDTDTSNN